MPSYLCTSVSLDNMLIGNETRINLSTIVNKPTVGIIPEPWFTVTHVAAIIGQSLSISVSCALLIYLCQYRKLAIEDTIQPNSAVTIDRAAWSKQTHRNPRR